MFRFIRSVSLVATLAAATAVAGAQPVTHAGAPVPAGSTPPASNRKVTAFRTPTSAICDVIGPVRGPYQNCKLTLQRNLLMMGTSKVVIVRALALHPIRLTQFVAGDSALKYARLYEKNTMRSMHVEVVGSSLFMAGFVTNHAGFLTNHIRFLANRRCNAVIHFCTSTPNHRAIAFTEHVGLSMLALGVPMQIYARHQGYKAIDFYNATLTGAH
jgi:hypothetical protein